MVITIAVPPVLLLLLVIVVVVVFIIVQRRCNKYKQHNIKMGRDKGNANYNLLH